ncbi:MAG: hypothetical protein D6698_10255 [Gammaproteobacteria bacterium]|nr:MAG: hypothetical protein D6698_10255 [Gammaproteobacteria bacterium]
MATKKKLSKIAKDVGIDVYEKRLTEALRGANMEKVDAYLNECKGHLGQGECPCKAKNKREATKAIASAVVPNHVADDVDPDVFMEFTLKDDVLKKIEECCGCHKDDDGIRVDKVYDEISKDSEFRHWVASDVMPLVDDDDVADEEQ